MLLLRTTWGSALVKRYRHRIDNGEAELQQFLPLMRLHFDPDVRGDLSFEDAEALFCEGKDALLSKRGDRRREFKTASRLWTRGHAAHGRR